MGNVHTLTSLGLEYTNKNKPRMSPIGRPTANPTIPKKVLTNPISYSSLFNLSQFNIHLNTQKKPTNRTHAAAPIHTPQKKGDYNKQAIRER